LSFAVVISPSHSLVGFCLAPLGSAVGCDSSPLDLAPCPLDLAPCAFDLAPCAFDLAACAFDLDSFASDLGSCASGLGSFALDLGSSSSGWDSCVGLAPFSCSGSYACGLGSCACGFDLGASKSGFDCDVSDLGFCAVSYVHCGGHHHLAWQHRTCGTLCYAQIGDRCTLRTPNRRHEAQMISCHPLDGHGLSCSVHGHGLLCETVHSGFASVRQNLKPQCSQPVRSSFPPLVLRLRS